MTRRTFIMILFLMTLSLGGIITLQVYWIRSSIHVEELEFDRKVNSALAEVSDKLEANEASRFIRSKFNIDSLRYITLEKAEKKTRPYRPKASIFKVEEQRPATEIAISSGQSNISVAQFPELLQALTGDSIFSNEVSIVTTDSGCMTSVITSNSKTIYRINKTVTASLPVPPAPPSPPSVPPSPSPSPSSSGSRMIMVFKTDSAELKKRIDNKADKLKMAIDKLVMELENNQPTPASRLKDQPLEQYLHTAFSRQGIHLPFDFRVKTNTADSNDSDTAVTGYTATLFPNDLPGKGSQLLVSFPGKNEFIMQSMTGMFSLSMIFTLIILAMFAVSIYTIVHQKKLSEIKNDFINNMTHEFKTPIATISLAVDSINNEKIIHDTGRLRHYAGVIREENKRMNTQVEKVLQLAMTEKNDFSISKAYCNIHELIENAIGKHRMLSDEKKIPLVPSLSAEKHFTLADAFHLEHAIGNIIDNAIKYSETDTRVDIQTTNTPEHLEIRIKDRGMGMSREVQKKIFDKFYRAQSGNLHDVKGFGIGLSYVKNIVDAHSGEILLESIKGNGTTFTIKLPL